LYGAKKTGALDKGIKGFRDRFGRKGGSGGTGGTGRKKIGRKQPPPDDN